MIPLSRRCSTEAGLALSTLEPRRTIVYERVADYWGAKLPVNVGQYNFDRIRFEYYRDATVALEAFKADRLDFRAENNSKAWATGYAFKAVDAAGIPVDVDIGRALSIPVIAALVWLGVQRLRRSLDAAEKAD